MSTTGTGPVVAGVDFSPESAVATEYAAALAQQYEADLKLVCGMPLALPYVTGMLALEEQGMLLKSVQRDLAAVAALVQERHPGLHVADEVSALPGVLALAKESAAARLIVVGRRGHGGVARLLLGSVASQLPLSAHCPVIVTSGPAPAADHPVLACVDGTENGLSVVRFAAEEAVASGRDLVAVHVWCLPEPPGLATEFAWARDPAEADRQVRDAAAAMLSAALAGIEAEFPALRIQQKLVRSLSIAQALLDTSDELDAGLIVTASRGHSELAHLFLGSVSRALLIRSARPVAVLPR